MKVVKHLNIKRGEGLKIIIHIELVSFFYCTVMWDLLGGGSGQWLDKIWEVKVDFFVADVHICYCSVGI